MKNICWPWSHKWTKWVDAGTAVMWLSNHPIIIQERRCTVCNKAQRHIVNCNS